MYDRKWIKPEDLRQPGIQPVLDAMRQVEKEAPGLLDEALSASIDFAKRPDSGHAMQ